MQMGPEHQHPPLRPQSLRGDHQDRKIGPTNLEKDRNQRQRPFSIAGILQYSCFLFFHFPLVRKESDFPVFSKSKDKVILFFWVFGQVRKYGFFDFWVLEFL
jgi:hypothetical protein